MILYHAISSLHIIECILHHINYTWREKSILILPDFIVHKYPQYYKLKKLKLFSDVKLFNYMLIPHNQETVLSDIEKRYKEDIRIDIRKFKQIYCAGAHFYFSLYLINHNIRFICFEDASGMLSRAEEMYATLYSKFPVHAELANQYQLFSLTNPLIMNVYCDKSNQNIDVAGDFYINFQPVQEFERVPEKLQNKIISFFISKKYEINEGDVILLTQHLANLGYMTIERQYELYRYVIMDYLKGKTVIIKKHPDDTMDYKKIFPAVKYVIEEPFPSELLPFVINGKPDKIVTINSTGANFLKRYYNVDYIELLDNINYNVDKES